MNVEAQIRACLAGLEPESLELIDESAQHQGHAGWQPGGGTHWRLRIVSPRFAGQTTLARHRMVYESLGELMQHPIHALAIQARAPGENVT